MENSFSYQPAAGRYERMPYKYCGKSGLQLSTVSYTHLTLPTTERV